jgi:hypothetical protein
LPFTPLPDSRSLVPVSAVRNAARTTRADREAAKRVRKLSDDESDKAAAETRSERAEAPVRNADADFLPREADAAPDLENVRRGWAAPGTAPFVTQVLAQEVLKSGLHIEPWRQAIDAYERAAGAAAPRVRPPMP